MTKTSTAMSLVGSLAFVSIAALLGTAGHAANAQTRTYSIPPSYQDVPFARDGSVIDNGEVVGRDPDQNIRSDILREHGAWDRGGN